MGRHEREVPQQAPVWRLSANRFRKTGFDFKSSSKNFVSVVVRLLKHFCGAKTFSARRPLEIIPAFSNSSAAASSVWRRAPVGARQTGRQTGVWRTL
jgi:hypothetical protein